MSGRAMELCGARFDRLLVVSRCGSNAGGHAIWNCVCDCGALVVTNSKLLRSGHKRSCGCLHLERSTSHGMTGTSTYKSWRAMTQRCCDPNSISYPKYGAMGISICDRWRGDGGFVNFLSDMGERPTILHTIDRWPNRRGNYTPSNCRWGTKKEQAENRDTTILLSLSGETFSVSEWARKLGLRASTLGMRLRAGWSVEKALTQAKRKHSGMPKRT